MDEILSPEVKLKQSTKDAAYRLKNGSPDFRNALRERCRHRVKLKRGTLFNQMRNMNSKKDLEDTLSTIFISELRVMKSDLNIKPMEICDSSSDDLFDYELKLLEEIKSEIMQEQEQWIIAEYEAYLESLITPEDPANDKSIFCPVCQKCLLTSNGISVYCRNECIMFPPFVTLAKVKEVLQGAIDLHNSNCRSNFEFFYSQESEIQGLHVLCHDCSLFLKVIDC